MEQSKRNRGRKIRSFVWLAALAAVAAGGWACSSGSQSDPGGSSGASGSSSGSGSDSGGKNSTGSTGSGAANGSNGGDTGEGGAPGGAGDSGTGGSGTSGGTASGTGGNGTVGGGTVGGNTSTGTTLCDNGKDDDGDGLIDGFDPECSGPLDNDEGSFATGIPGDNRDPNWQDCFFDGNSGAGDDDCRYATGCLTGELPQTDKDCQLSDACVKFCAKLTVNGCDCFGCCTVTTPDGSTVDIHEAATCSMANIDDEKACPRCTKSTQCGNDCGECELCAGKTLEDLPAKCTPPPPGTGGASNGGASSKGGASSTGGTGGTTSSGGTSSGGTGGTTQTCEGGEAICGPNGPYCAPSEYCSFGCCIPSIR
jgi:hypothetical protein